MRITTRNDTKINLKGKDMEYFYAITMIFSVVMVRIIYNKMNKVINEHMDTLEQLDLALERENYLLKTMNDALNVTDMAGFIAQRMRNAPKTFIPKTREEINPDNVNA